jgi:hypothetical protein
MPCRDLGHLDHHGHNYSHRHCHAHEENLESPSDEVISIVNDDWEISQSLDNGRGHVTHLDEVVPKDLMQMGRHSYSGSVGASEEQTMLLRRYSP